MIAGVALGPIAAGLLVASPIAGRIADRRGPRRLVQAGLILTTLSFVGFALALDLRTPYVLIGLLMLVAGVGSRLFNSPNSSIIMGIVPADRRGIAAGVRTMLLSVGGIVSIIYTLSVVAANLPRDVMFKVFSGLASSLPAVTLEPFIQGVRTACWALAILSAVSVALTLLEPRPAGRRLRLLNRAGEAHD